MAHRTRTTRYQRRRSPPDPEAGEPWHEEDGGGRLGEGGGWKTSDTNNPLTSASAYPCDELRLSHATPLAGNNTDGILNRNLITKKR